MQHRKGRVLPVGIREEAPLQLLQRADDRLHLLSLAARPRRVREAQHHHSYDSTKRINEERRYSVETTRRTTRNIQTSCNSPSVHDRIFSQARFEQATKGCKLRTPVPEDTGPESLAEALQDDNHKRTRLGPTTRQRGDSIGPARSTQQKREHVYAKPSMFLSLCPSCADFVPVG